MLNRENSMLLLLTLCKKAMNPCFSERSPTRRTLLEKDFSANGDYPKRARKNKVYPLRLIEKSSVVGALYFFLAAETKGSRCSSKSSGYFLQ